MAAEYLSLFKVFMKENIDISNVLNSGFITQGKQVEMFESKLKEYFSYPRILTVNSGTSGLTLALRLLNLNIGDEVISTPLTCTATNWPILANGLKIKWADVDLETCNISLQSIREKLSEKTKAIMVVHWGGYPVDLDELSKIQDEAYEKYGFRPYIIEDCAHAFGAKYKGKYIGTRENICVFSLQAIKHLTCGDGGLIFLPTNELYERAKLLRWFGINSEKKESDIQEWGYKYHMNDINASIGLQNLPYIQDNLNKLNDIANLYRKRISKFKPEIKLLKEHKDFESARWIFTIKVVNKPQFIDFMKEKNIMVSQVHNRNDIHSCVSESKTFLPNLDILEKEMICIPAGWWLSPNDTERILTSLEEWYKINKLTFRRLNKNDYEKGYMELISRKCESKKAFEDILTHIDYQLGELIVGEINGELVCSGRIQVDIKFESPVVRIEDIVVKKEYRKNQIGTRLINYLTKQAEFYSPYKIILTCSEELIHMYQKCNYQVSGAYMKYVKQD